MLSPSLTDLRMRGCHHTVIEFEAIARDHVQHGRYPALMVEPAVWGELQNQCKGVEVAQGPAMLLFLEAIAQIEPTKPLIDQLVRAVEESVWEAAKGLKLASGLFMLLPSQRSVRHRRDARKNLAFGNQLKLWSAFRIYFGDFRAVIPDPQFVLAMSKEAEGKIAPAAKYACRLNNEVLLGTDLRIDRHRGVGYYLTDARSSNSPAVE